MYGRHGVERWKMNGKLRYIPGEVRSFVGGIWAVLAQGEKTNQYYHRPSDLSFLSFSPLRFGLNID